MKAGTKGVLIALGTLVVIGGVYYYIRRRDPRNAVETKMKSMGKRDKGTKNVFVKLGDGGNYAVFYDNSRFFVFNDKNQWLYKGGYKKGGSELVVTEVASAADSSMKGKTLEDSNAFTNISKLKK